MVDWKRIETAPKDGTLIALVEGAFLTSALWRAVYSAWMTPTDDGWQRHVREPTHWARLDEILPPFTAIAAGSREGHDSEAWRGAKQARAARSASPPCPTSPLYDALAEDDDILDETAPSNSQDKSHDPTR